MTLNIKDAIALAAEIGPNMNEAAAFTGGDYTPAAEGFVKLRFVEYIELGTKDEEYNGKAKPNQDKAWFGFELSGPNHPPIEITKDGKVVETRPQYMGFEITRSLNEKSTFYKLFKAMNYAGTATHFSQLLGDAYIGTVKHTKKTYDGKERTFANLKDDAGFTIRKPVLPDPETGKDRVVSVDDPKLPLRLFVWDIASGEVGKAMWDSLYIDGEWAERKDDKGNVTTPAQSKNKHQLRIAQAKNFKGSPASQLADDAKLVLPAATKPPRSAANSNAAAEDPLQRHAVGQNFDLDEEIPF